MTALLLAACLIIGDSLAAGIALHRPECSAITVVGGTTRKIAKLVPMSRAQTAIVSLGSNDPVADPAGLAEVRNRIDARVTWILPNPTRFPSQRLAVIRIARERGDRTAEPAAWSPDRVHPTNRAYRRLAQP